MYIQKINSQEEFQNYSAKMFDEFYQEWNWNNRPDFPTTDLYKGINCTHFAKSICMEKLRISLLYLAAKRSGKITDDDQIAVFHDNGHGLGIYSADKYIWLDWFTHTILMKQLTPEGVYELSLSTRKEYADKFAFYSNENISKVAEKEPGLSEEDAKSKFDRIKFRLAHEIAYHCHSQSLQLPKINLPIGKPTDEFTRLANKLYRKGLPYVAELAQNGGNLEITDEDRSFYEAPSENHSDISDNQIQAMSDQLYVLNKASEFFQLPKSQEKLRRELETFFDMKGVADAEVHSSESIASDENGTRYNLGFQGPKVKVIK